MHRVKLEWYFLVFLFIKKLECVEQVNLCEIINRILLYFFCALWMGIVGPSVTILFLMIC